MPPNPLAVTTRTEAEKAIRAVISDARASYVLKHEVKPENALDLSVAALLDELVWPVLIRLGYAAQPAEAVECPLPERDPLEVCGCGHRAAGHIGCGGGLDDGPCRWCPCARFGPPEPGAAVPPALQREIDAGRAPETTRQP